MEMTVLVCDLCTKQRNAVIRLVLLNGKTNVASLDLCPVHNKKLMQFIQPRRRHKAGVIHAVSRRKKSTVAELIELRKRILSLLGRTDKLPPKNISDALGVPIWKISGLLKGLVKDDKLVKDGKGRSVSYRRK
jgi:hypothetical protein